MTLKFRADRQNIHISFKLSLQLIQEQKITNCKKGGNRQFWEQTHKITNERKLSHIEVGIPPTNDKVKSSQSLSPIGTNFRSCFYKNVKFWLEARDFLNFPFFSLKMLLILRHCKASQHS